MRALVILAPVLLVAATVPLYRAVPQDQVADEVEDSVEDSVEEPSEQPSEPGQWQARERQLMDRISELEGQLVEVRNRAIEREQLWVDYLSALSNLPLQQVPDAPEFLAGRGEPGDSPVELPQEDNNDARRSKLLRDLNALLMAEQVLSMDVLELGVLHEGWCGPVVVRLLDERGRPVGVLAAEHLHLEVSRSGYGVTLLFQDGYERHAGTKVPFGAPTEPGSERGGLRRIHLPGLDPKPWLETLPELVRELDLPASLDDGLWDLRTLRTRIDGLLRGSDNLEPWRLLELGGVVGRKLRDVQLLERDGNGREVRRLFADRMTLHAEEGGGVRLELEGGVMLRRGRRAPFLGDRYRIFLPRADAAAWRSARVPGLARPRAPEEAKPPADEG